jgi:hypothetical protein
MRRHVLLVTLLLLVVPAVVAAQSSIAVEPAHFAQVAALPDTGSANAPQAVQLSDAYYTRLTIHRYGSYAELPLFGAEYLLGHQLINGTTTEWVRPAHKAVAFSLGALFAVNTVTGVWNAIEARHEKEGRGTRLLHAGLMLAADAGFAYTGTLANNATNGTQDDKNKHRNAALFSIGLATTGTLVMWLRQ